MHLARYEFARPYARNRRVLDIGSGEGYGAELLSREAREVVGLDYSRAAIEHARMTHQAENLQFIVGNSLAMDESLGTFDVITCFEVVEHVERDELLWIGMAKILRPGGWLVLSTPNALVDSLFDAIRGAQNEYHVNLLTPKQLRRRASRYFRQVTLYGQYQRSNMLHSFLKAVDVLNLRHRAIRSKAIQRQLVRRMRKGDGMQSSFRFSRWLVRQSPALTLTARGQ